ncbi:MAG: nuclear transport factor 2 family protein [Pyrinomonadaceae bacterium]|nr:nuclear transport factor 2 family protein [Pyrinomonadaceae bacterium]
MKTLLGILTVLLFSCNVAFGECSAADKKALEAFDREWARAGQAGDRAKLSAIYADEFVSMPDMAGKAAMIDNTVQNAQAGGGANAAATIHDRYLFGCAGSTATITHRNIITATSPSGQTETFWTRSIHFLEKRGGTWQIVSTTGHEMGDQMVIGYLEQDWNDANLRRDKAWFEKNFASDFVGVSSMTGKVVGKAEDIADTMNDKGTIELAETSDLEINVIGDRARVIGIYRYKGKDEKGAAYDRKIRFTDTWIKRDGRWQAWSSTGVAIP